MFWISFISDSQTAKEEKEKKADVMPSEVPCEMKQKSETRYWKILQLACNTSHKPNVLEYKDLVLCFRLFSFCGQHGNSKYGFAFSKPCETGKIGRGNKPLWNAVMDLRLPLFAGCDRLTVVKDAKDLSCLCTVQVLIFASLNTQF